MINIRLLEELKNKHPKKIKCYPVDLKKLMRGLGNILGEVDSEYINFLKITNGISIFDICFLGIKNSKLYPANVYNEMLDLWYKNPYLSDKFWCFATSEDENYFGYLNKKNSKNNHYIGFYNSKDMESIYLISSSFDIFFNNFLLYISNKINYDENLMFIDLLDFVKYSNSLANDIELYDFLSGNKDYKLYK